MRALLGILCLFAGAPAALVDDAEHTRNARRAEYRAIIAEIAPGAAAASRPVPLGLPEDLQQALETWTES